MLTTPEADKIISAWIDYARIKNMIDYVRGLWLLRDFIGGGLSDEYYRNHAGEVAEFLDGLDSSKEDVQKITEYMKIIVDRYV